MPDYVFGVLRHFFCFLLHMKMAFEIKCFSLAYIVSVSLVYSIFDISIN